MNTETTLLIAIGVAMLMVALVYTLISGGIDQAESSIFGTGEEDENSLIDRGKNLDEESSTGPTSGRNKFPEDKEVLRGV